MSFKTLHSFTVTIKQVVPEVTTRVEGGQTITTKTDVEKDVHHKFVLKEPSRREKQELALFQDVMYNEAINKGLLPQIVMQQKLGKQADSPLSGDEDKNLTAMNARLQELANDYMRLNASHTPETDEQKERKQRLQLEYMVLYKKVEDLNTAYQSIYAHTAEKYKQTKTLNWLTLFLTFKAPTTPEGKPEAYFVGSDFIAREDFSADLDDAGDKLHRALVEKVSVYWMLYLFNRANTPEDFVRIEEEWAKQEEAGRKIKEEADKVAAAKQSQDDVPALLSNDYVLPREVAEAAKTNLLNTLNETPVPVGQ